ncbi:hypothetical protein Tco_0692132 [Tanacetum coccineum]
MANTTPIVTTVTKPATKEKMPKEADATPWGNIQDFCEKHYEDILPVIMEKIRRNKRKEVHARLDFKESPSKKRIREGSKNSSVRTLSVRARLIELVILTRQAQLNLDQTEQTPGIVPIVEVALTRMTLLTEIILKAETALVQKKYVKDPVEIHNVKQRDGETIEEFMERFKLETKRMKGAPECIRIFGFMHGVNNPELTKCLNEHVPKTMEEMMVTTIAFIRGEAAATGKKKESNSKLRTCQRNYIPFADQSFEHVREITFPSLITSSRTEGPLVIEAEIGGHMIHRMYVDGGDADHSTRAWMNFMIVRSLSPYNGIIGRPEIREIKDVPSIAHGMHKFPVDGGIVTIHSTILIPANVSATYQRLVDKVFDNQVGRNIEVYVDELVIKSHTEAEMLSDIDKMFRTLRKINMKLNLKKCTFGAVEGMFLGYMISPEGIRPCPNKTEAVLQLSSPRTIKEV